MPKNDPRLLLSLAAFPASSRISAARYSITELEPSPVGSGLGLSLGSPLPWPDFVVISGIYLVSLYYIHNTPLYYYLSLAGGADAVGTGGVDHDKLLALCRILLEEQHGWGSAGEIIENASDAGKGCKGWGRLVFFTLVEPQDARHPTVLHITNVKNQ